MSVEYLPEKNVTRYLAYFDLLGTQELIQAKKIRQVFAAYAIANKKLAAWSKRHPQVAQAWFSDTFILYTKDDSAQSFRAIEIVCRWFVYSLLRNRIPVRGALACGEFYADVRTRSYLGEALLEAYEWGENQDWIGFILSPSAASRLESVGLAPQEKLNYRAHDVCFKKKPNGVCTVSIACLLGNWIKSGNDENFLLRPLREMCNKQSDKRVRDKYERTIAFLEKYDTVGLVRNGS